MDYHKNAPWTAISRERRARMVISDGITLSSAAARFSVSAKTAAKWVDRYRQFRAAGMGGWPRSRRSFSTTPRVPPVPRFWGPGR